MRRKWKIALLLTCILVGMQSGMAAAGTLNEKVFGFKLRQAEKGVVESQYSVGERFAVGLGVGRDPQQAFHWFKKAAEAGYARAQFKVGECLETGQGTTADVDEAYLWYGKAAAQDDAAAKQKLAARKQQASLVAKRKADAHREALERADREKAALEKAARESRERAEQELAETRARELAEQEAQQKEIRERAERERALTVSRLVDILRVGGWTAFGTPVEFVPSQRTSCVKQGDRRMLCFTDERNVNVGDSHVRYQAKSEIELNAGGKFGIHYRYQVLKLQSADSSLPAHDQPTVPRLELGWQEPGYHLQCELVNPAAFSCTDQQGQTLALSR